MPTTLDIREIKLETETKAGTRLRSPATVQFLDGRIYFVKSPFSLKNEIKAMKGSRWHGHDEEDGRKIWSVEDCQRNRLQLAYLQGEDVFAWFDREVTRHEYRDTFLNGKPADLMPHQKDLADSGLTYHYQIWAAEMGVGKTLAAQKVIEKSGVRHWWWIGPKSSIPNIKREFRKWGFHFDEFVEIEFLTYEGLTDRIDKWSPEDALPQGVIFDESSRLKGYASQRTRAAQRLADMIRDQYGYEGYVILMSGTPSPKTPMDWWSQCEIAWPGFLKEGSTKALEQRMAFIVQQEFESGIFPKRVGWKDDENKCAECGSHYGQGDHEQELCDNLDNFHKFVPSVNEVAYMYERLKGLVVIKLKKDCLTLPEKRYRKIYCKPSASTLRVAAGLADVAPNTITGMTWLRELSDGFQYRDVVDGMSPCPHCPEHSGKVDEWFDPCDDDRNYKAIDMLNSELVDRLEKRTVDCPRCDGSREVQKIVRITREVACPKVAALKKLIEECEETGRIVVFAGFTGSVDRVQGICHGEKWAVVRCDGRGFQVTSKDGEILPMSPEDALGFWADTEKNPRVAFVAHPESGGMSLTLTEARMCVYWSNSFKPEYRSQSEDRIHRKGMNENLGCVIVDLVHLPTDERVLEVIQENRKIELMTMGEFAPSLDCAGLADDAVVIEELDL